MKQKQPLLKERGNRSKGIGRENLVGLALALIPVIGFTIFGLLPMILAVVMSFMKIKGFHFDGASIVGWENYAAILQDEKFYTSVGNTFYAALALPISMVLALLIAVLLNRRCKGTKAFRTVFFIPYVCSVVALMTMWKWLFEEEFGILNQILAFFGKEPIGWISDSSYVRESMIFTGVWSGMGLGILLYSASLSNVPKAYYEAAMLDGAGGFKQFLHITLPAISPTTFYLLVTGMIAYLQDFVRFQTMLGNAGGPSNSGLTMVFYLWQMAFRYNTTMGMGMASAMAILVALIIGGVTALLYASAKWWVSYDY